jgi:hypothetical protein
MTVEESGTARCPWCSAPLSDPDLASCPSCGASLRGTAADEIPGLTAVDPLVAARSRPAPQRSRLLGWLAGEAPDVPDPAPTRPGAGAALVVDDERASLEPPSPEVRLEMLRLEREALEAEAALRAVPELAVDAPPSGEPDLGEAEPAAAPMDRPPAPDEGARLEAASPVPAEPDVATRSTRRRSPKGRSARS